MHTGATALFGLKGVEECFIEKKSRSGILFGLRQNLNLAAFFTSHLTSKLP